MGHGGHGIVGGWMMMREGMGPKEVKEEEEEEEEEEELQQHTMPMSAPLHWPHFNTFTTKTRFESRTSSNRVTESFPWSS